MKIENILMIVKVKVMSGLEWVALVWSDHLRGLIRGVLFLHKDLTKSKYFSYTIVGEKPIWDNMCKIDFQVCDWLLHGDDLRSGYERRLPDCN